MGGAWPLTPPPLASPGETFAPTSAGESDTPTISQKETPPSTNTHTKGQLKFIQADLSPEKVANIAQIYLNSIFVSSTVSKIADANTARIILDPLFFCFPGKTANETELRI